ncbi:glycosyltransferase family 2 protein [bacterium]|nr:glycosyltransferase family 2 protein [bacterium]
MTPLLSIIIVNYNSAGFIADCLDSVLASVTSDPFEVIVIDNASTDNSPEIIKTYKTKITFIQNPENSGFARGNNLCLPHCKGDYLLLLNNDTLVPPTALQGMLNYFKSNPKTGALSPKLLNRDGSLQPQGSGLGSWRFKSKTPLPVSFISGACLMTPKPLYESIGGLDENLFFYNEDTDFCNQLKKLKRPIIYLPTVEITHFGGLATSTRKPQSMVAGYRGSLYLCRKYYPWFCYPLFRVLIWVDVLPRLLIYTLLSPFMKSKRPYRNAMIEIAKIVLTGDVPRPS